MPKNTKTLTKKGSEETIGLNNTLQKSGASKEPSWKKNENKRPTLENFAKKKEPSTISDKNNFMAETSPIGLNISPTTQGTSAITSTSIKNKEELLTNSATLDKKKESNGFLASKQFDFNKTDTFSSIRKGSDNISEIKSEPNSKFGKEALGINGSSLKKDKTSSSSSNQKYASYRISKNDTNKDKRDPQGRRRPSGGATTYNSQDQSQKSKDGLQVTATTLTSLASIERNNFGFNHTIPTTSTTYGDGSGAGRDKSNSISRDKRNKSSGMNKDNPNSGSRENLDGVFQISNSKIGKIDNSKTTNVQINNINN